MNTKNIADILHSFFNNKHQNGENLIIYYVKDYPNLYFQNLKIGVDINKFKEVILEEDTELELGGFGRKSFSLACPIVHHSSIKDRSISLLGSDISPISVLKTDFGMFLLLKFKKLTDNLYREVNKFDFISNGIEGFSIRTIPRRFWCRISKNLLQKGFNMEFFGNALYHLYKSKFNELQSMEIFFINSNSHLIEEFINITSHIRLGLEKKWKNRVEEWKKRVDCDYEWGCDICPDYNECDSIRELLATRNKLDI